MADRNDRLDTIMLAVFGGVALSLLLAWPVYARGGAGYLGATVNPSASTVAASWSSGSASATTLTCNNKAAADAGTQTSTTAHSGIVAGLTPTTPVWCSAQSGSTVTAMFKAWTTPAPTSTPITSVSIATSPAEPVANQFNSDTFYNVVADDGTTYFTGDDSHGPCGASETGEANLRINRFTSESPLTCSTINSFSAAGGGVGSDNFSPKWSGLYSQAGVLYGTVGRQFNGSSPGYPTGVTNGQYPQRSGHIMKSTDKGVNWCNFQGTCGTTGAQPSPVTTSMFDGGTSTATFAVASFVMYGADDGGKLGYQVDNSDAYVYVTSNDGFWNNGNSQYLARVLKAKLANLSGADYQYYKGGDGALDTAWGSSFANAVPILTDTGHTGMSVVQYVPSVGRYLFWTWYYPTLPTNGTSANTTVWVVREAAHPWGPWTTVLNYTWANNGGWYNPVPLVRSVLSAKPDDAAHPITLLTAGNFINFSTTYHLMSMTATFSVH